MKFREKLARFFYGRYGTDQLNTFILVLYAVFLLLNMFFGRYLWGLLFWIPAAVCVFLYFFRMLSRNIHIRRAENEKFMKAWKKFTGFFKLQRNKFRDRKTHVYRRCPSCRAMLRLPKKKGEHSVCCPACRKSFGVKI